MACLIILFQIERNLALKERKLKRDHNQTKAQPKRISSNSIIKTKLITYKHSFKPNKLSTINSSNSWTPLSTNFRQLQMVNKFTFQSKSSKRSKLSTRSLQSKKTTSLRTNRLTSFQPQTQQMTCRLNKSLSFSRMPRIKAKRNLTLMKMER